MWGEAVLWAELGSLSLGLSPSGTCVALRLVPCRAQASGRKVLPGAGPSSQGLYLAHWFFLAAFLLEPSMGAICFLMTQEMSLALWLLWKPSAVSLAGGIWSHFLHLPAGHALLLPGPLSLAFPTKQAQMSLCCLTLSFSKTPASPASLPKDCWGSSSCQGPSCRPSPLMWALRALYLHQSYLATWLWLFRRARDWRRLSLF